MAKNSKVSLQKFLSLLDKSKTEEDVKGAYAKFFDIDYQTSARHDLYTPQVFFEFKYDKNFQNLKARATILAQALYYIRRLKYKDAQNPISPLIGLADRNEAILTETQLWERFYHSDRYDWDLAPSSPHSLLIEDLCADENLRQIQIYNIENETEFQFFVDKLTQSLNNQLVVNFNDKKVISEDNFEEVFQYWNKIFGDDVRNGLKTSKYFVCDIQEGKTLFVPQQNQVVFMFDGTDAKVKKIFAADYQNFWSLYQKVSNPDTIRGIIAKIDRLTDETMRRFHGEFFTPLPFAKKALDYLEKTVGAHWWRQGYKLWDMAAGTGNLEYHLPTEAYPHCFLSSLYKEDVEHLQKLFPAAHTFQYDYLNDDIANVFADNILPFELTWKLPTPLRKELQNPDNKWIILINPPFATASLGINTNHKLGASDSALRKIMHSQNLGETSRELFSQFLFRIRKEFENKTAFLGLFSKIKYLNSNNDQHLRDRVFQFTYQKGFIFSIKNFIGTTGSFPVGFLIWNLSQAQAIENQTIELDIFNNEVEKIGTKIMQTSHRDRFLNKWIDRPKCTIKFPPFSSALVSKFDAADRRDRIAEGFIGCLLCSNNDMQHQNLTALLSAPFVSPGALSIVAENFEQAQVVHAVRRIPKADWINDRDQFMQPNGALSDEFISDCCIWNIFSNSNQTVAMRNVSYEKQIYQIDNHFFPFLKSALKTWTISDSDIRLSLTLGEERFMALWLQNRQLSAAAQAVWEAGEAIYKFYFENSQKLRLNKFKIETWDAGWWQIRNVLEEQNLADDLFKTLKIAHNTLKDKLLPQIFDYGFL